METNTTLRFGPGDKAYARLTANGEMRIRYDGDQVATDAYLPPNEAVFLAESIIREAKGGA